MTKNLVKVKEWNPESMGSLSEGAVRALCIPNNRYRISTTRYPKNTKFSGAMRKSTCYVLEGACRFRLPHKVELQAGQFTVIHEGEYEFEVLGDTDVVFVMVWKLPIVVVSSGES